MLDNLPSGELFTVLSRNQLLLDRGHVWFEFDVLVPILLGDDLGEGRFAGCLRSIDYDELRLGLEEAQQIVGVGRGALHHY